MKVKELIEKLREMPEEMPVVLCNLENDGDGDGVVCMAEIENVEIMKANKKVGPHKDIVLINYRQL